jgi:phosphoglycerate dehydrogenase-like enzyme
MFIKILVCDPIDIKGIEKLRHEDFEVDVMSSIEKAELEKVFADYDALVV